MTMTVTNDRNNHNDHDDKDYDTPDSHDDHDEMAVHWGYPCKKIAWQNLHAIRVK